MSTQVLKAVGVYANNVETETALIQLRDAGFPMNQVSVVGLDKDYESRVDGVEVKQHVDNHAEEGAATGVAAGGALGGLGGILVGLGALAIPGVGPIMLAGAAATAAATTVAGGAIGAATGGLTGALIGLNIPDDHAKTYSELIENGYYLVIVDGTDQEIHLAESVLSRSGIQRWQVYPAPHRVDAV